MSLFPFLAVLICIMGVLILLLVIAVRASTANAESIVAERVKQRDSESKELQQRKNALDDAEFVRAALAESRTKTSEQLNDARLKLAHLEDHIRRLEDDLRRLQRDSQTLDASQRNRLTDRQAAEQELARLQGIVAENRAALEKAKEEVAKRPRGYALIPYDGPNGTRRRPVYIECRGDQVIIQPEGTVLSDADFRPPLDPGNPLAAALRATREHLAAQRELTGEQGEPYPLLVVRPNGTEAYAAARSALRNWDAEFGYELVEDNIELNFGKADVTLGASQVRAIEDARRRRQLLEAAAPSRYRGSGGGGEGYAVRTTPAGTFEKIAVPGGSRGPRGGAGGPESAGFGAGQAAGSGPSSTPPPDYASRPGAMKSPAIAAAAPGEKPGSPHADPSSRPGAASPPGATSSPPGGASGDTAGGAANGAASPTQRDVKSVSGSKGSNWGLPNGTAPIAFQRPISAICFADRIVLVPEAGDFRGPVVVNLAADPTTAVVNELAPAIAKRIERWGIAGKNSYWRPVLDTAVQPGGEARWAEFQVLMHDSGIELQRRTP